MNENQEPYVKLKEVLHILPVHRVTLWRWARSGKIPARQIGRTWFVKISEVEAAILTTDPKGE